MKLEGSGAQALADEQVFVPMFMCYAFSLEIYLKFLILVRTGRNPPHLHDTATLFRKLPHDVSDRIRYRWNNPHPGLATIRHGMSNRTGKRPLSFEETLQLSSDAFQKLRYSYQYGTSALEWRGGDIAECTRMVIFEDLYPTEYAEARLPLPDGVLNLENINAVKDPVFQYPPWKPK